MQIQTYSGRTLVDALQQVKTELGDEAIILSSRRAEDLSRLPEGHLIEVVAALPASTPTRKSSPAREEGASREPRAWTPPRLNQKRSPARAEVAAPLRRTTAADAAVPPLSPGAPASRQDLGDLGSMLELKEDMLQMRRALRDVNRAIRFGPHQSWQRGADDILQRLDGLGVSRPLACQLLDELPEGSVGEEGVDSYLLKSMARRLPCNPELPAPADGPAIMAFVGPTGVGKTTALVKLLLSKQGLQAKRGAIVTLDTKRIAAVEQIRRLGALARIRVERVYRQEEIAEVRDRLSGCDWILVDTPGAGPRERLGLERTRHLLKSIRPHQIHLVLAANMSLADQLANVKAWRDARVDRLLVTKLDEASARGSLLDLAERAGLPFHFGGVGQNVSGDLVRLGSTSLARIILNGTSVTEAAEQA